jgi:hypothetical protein
LAGDHNLIYLSFCAQALANVYVSIIDLLECWETNEIPRYFRNDRELTEYSMSTGKVYPREAAKQD